ncbi:hypothetical protein CONPUDRAFT_54999, partial [Coniophora puteana RWD-64-598 SS2]
ALRSTLIKLVIFSVSLAVLPLSSYFLSQKYVWAGAFFYAAITAIFMANAVLVAYIISSVLEDQQSAPPLKAAATELESKKQR